MHNKSKVEEDCMGGSMDSSVFYHGQTSRAVILNIDQSKIQVYGDRKQLQDIIKSIPSLSNETTIAEDNWGTFLRCKSISTQMSYLLASNYAFFKKIHWPSNVVSRSSEVWAKRIA